jgi:tetratricopeptide (TPR) repeat protein
MFPCKSLALVILLAMPVPLVVAPIPALSQATQDRESEANRLFSQGIQQYQTGQVAAALQSWEQALALYRQIKDRQGEGVVLGNLGIAYKFLGNYAKAIEYQQQSLAIARQLKDRSAEGAALGNLGNAHWSLGNYAKAIEYQQQLLVIALQTNDRRREGGALGNLGSSYQALGNYAKAIEYHQQLLAIARQLNDRQGEGVALGNLGIAYTSLGNYAKAIEYQQQSLVIARQLNDRQGEGQTLGNLGIAYKFLGNYAKAIEYHQQSLVIAREIKDRWSEGQALGNLGSAYRSLGNYAKAIEYQQQRLAIAREIKDRLGEGQALNNLGIALLRSKNLVGAEKHLLEGIAVWESLRAQLGDNDANKISIFEEQSRTYQLLQQVLVVQNKTEAALEIAERGRSRAFVELLAQRLQKTGTAPAAIPPPNLQQIRQIAKAQNATLVQYSTIGSQRLYLWVIQPTGEIAFRQVDLQASLPKGVSLEEYVRMVRSDSLGVRGLGVVAKPGATPTQNSNQLQGLYRLLVEPIAPLLPRNPSDRIIFLPQDSLFLVPFAALKAPSGKYLIEQHTVLTSPSIQVLELTRQKQLSREKVTGKLIVGNPTMPTIALVPGESPEQLPELPGAEAEAKAIAQFLNTPFLTGDRATKAVVKQQMSTARLIHLATHGLLDDHRGIGSAIALAPSGGDNGLLTAEEILDLKLNADLVVLSACDTGRGKVTGDGVIGLSRSLISAGAPSVIVSLWAVPDAPTSALMTQFYRNLQTNPDKAQALRQAMLTTMQQHPKPRDWAAFTLIGEAE